ncbi:MAG: tyrosine-type recombinase/integrase [Candidatus Nealsonbacteria bacterium]
MSNKSLIIPTSSINNDLINPDAFKNQEILSIVIDPKKTFNYLDISSGSRADYKYRLGLFLNFMRNKSLSLNCLLEYKRYLKNLINYSTATKNHYLLVGLKLLREYHRQGILKRDITSNIELFKEEKNKMKVEEFNEQEMTKILNALKELPNTKENSRLKAMMSLLIFQGLRLIELTRIDYPADVDFGNKIIQIQGKGKEYKQPVDLHPKTIAELKKYVSTNGIKSGSLFFCKSNRNLHQKITTSGIRKIIKKFLKSLGIDRNIHAFRHSFCGMLALNKNLTTLDMAQFSRHSNPAQLQAYIDRRKFKSKIPEFYKCFRGWNMR